jgi:thymidine kinase
MAKLYFKYGAMGSSKTAQALITKFNYEERGMRVWLIKPAIETRDGEFVRSRIGLEAKAELIENGCDLLALFEAKKETPNVIIADECQFFEKQQIDALRTIVDEKNVPVLAFGLRTDFRTELFEGSKRLFELADSISEIKTICTCGRKATVNARVDESGDVLTSGAKVLLGGNESYTALCHRCYKERIKTGAKN